MTTVWIYVDTRYRVGHPDHIKAFATPEVADEWFQANDREGVAFSYNVIRRLVPAPELGPLRPAGTADKYGVPRAEE
jgi:hypothetical protein